MERTERCLPVGWTIRPCSSGFGDEAAHLNLARNCKRAIALSVLALLTSPVAAQDQMPAGFDDPGPKPTDVLPPIVANLRATLRDPASVRDFRLCEPEVSKPFRYPGVGNTWERARWTVRFSLNGRNGFGGYAGRQAFSATYRDGKLTDVASPNLGPDLNAKMVNLTNGCPSVSDAEIQRLLQQ